MTATGFTLFDTAIGRCGVAWGGRGLLAVQLPEARASATRAHLLQRFPQAREAPPPAAIQETLVRIVALLRGETSDLTEIALDMTGLPPFHRRVYEAARAIPPGATLSYGGLAERIDAPGAARAVGQAMRRNPFPIVVPCHRVLAAGGKLGGYSANGGLATKLRMLSIEGAWANGTATDFAGDGALGFDLATAVAHLRAVDATLARVIDAVGPCRLRLDKAPSLFFALAEAIVYQQLTARAAGTIFARLRAAFPHARHAPTAEQILRASDEKLRSAGLSRSKLLSLRDLARRTIDGDIPKLAELSDLTDEAIIERLTEVRGIGRWTVEMLLIFRFGRPDVLPADDHGIRKGYAAAFKKRALPTPKELAERGARWQPYRTVASWYLWRAAERAAPQREPA
jgi:methylated-DNA-[protein]-cysteine S-methyltransferase